MRLRLLAAAAVLAVSSAGLVTAATGPAQAGTTPVLFGLTDHWKDNILSDDNQLNIHAGVVDLFQGWVADSTRRATISNWMTWVRTTVGGAPMLTLQPPSTASLSAINSGKYDSYLRAWAHTFAAWKNPMFVRLFPEMNQKSHTYSPGYGSNTASQFRTAWKHVVTLMRGAGATNVAFIWCPYRIYSGSTSLSSVWPGYSYVNWVAFDAYNYADSTHPFVWPYALFSPTVKAIRNLAPAKPLMIAEVGANDPQKPTWVTKSVSAAQSVGAKAMLWFDEVAAHNWRLDSSSSVLSAARTAIHSSTSPLTWAGHTFNGVKWSPGRIDTLVSTGK